MLVEADGKTAIRTLLPQELTEMIKEGKIDVPKITEEQIRDKSKGDFISKGVVALQITWFLTQCVARHLQHLPLTELELVTAAFSVLSLFTYIIWWRKPLDINEPVPVIWRMSEPPKVAIKTR